MKSIPTIILTNRVLIPIKLIDSDTIKTNYDKWIYDQKSCQRCEYKHERHSEFCDPCDAFKGHFIQYKKVVKKGKSYWSLPRAELYRLQEFGITDYKLKNLMSRGTKLDSRIEITKTPYDYQKKSIKELVLGDNRKNYFPHGILKAAPRSGKCVVGSTLVTTEFGTHPIQDLFEKDHKDGEIREANIKINTAANKIEYVSHLYKKTVDQTIEIVTANGSYLRGTPEHPVLVLDSTSPKHVWKRLSEVRAKEDFVCTKKTSVDSTSIPTIANGDQTLTLTPELASLLGYTMAIGSLQNKNCVLSVFGKQEIEQHVQKIAQEFGFVSTVVGNTIVFDYKLTTMLSNLISFEKDKQQIPAVILCAPQSLQKYFIDAFALANGNKVFGHMLFAFDVDNKIFALQQKILLQNMGIFADQVKPRAVSDYYIIFLRLNSYDPKLLKLDTKITTDEFIYDLVETKTVIDNPITVYDVTVPGSHSFVGNGIVVHNTLMSLISAIKLKRKTLILANQEDLLKQFIIELKESTNIEDIDKFDGKVSFGMCSKVADFEKYDICLATYQTFISKLGKEKLKKVRKLFGTVFVDEAHGCAASAFSKVIDSFSAQNRFGLTATEKRKDKLDFITQQILGPVVTEATVDSLIPRVVIIPTGIAPKYNYRTWNAAMQFLANNEARNKLILQWIKKDLKEGRKIVIPVTYKKQVQELVEAVRKMGYTSEAFVGGMNRDALLARARAGDIDVVVGIRSILGKGINVKIWSVIYTIAPISNPPNYYQETTRICTPLEGKPEPIIRLFVDQMPMTKGCFRTCWTQTILPMKYRFSEKTRQKAKEILSTMRGGYKEDFEDGTGEDGKVYRDATLFDIGGKSINATKKKSIAVKKPQIIKTIGLFR